MSAVSNYLARAADCAQQARDSDLDNVRDRFLRSEEVWRQMAERLMGQQVGRLKDAVDKLRQAANES